MKLLLVEDNPAMQATLQSSFERCATGGVARTGLLAQGHTMSALASCAALHGRGRLLPNAIRHSPTGARLAVTLARAGVAAQLLVANGGPRILKARRQRRCQPFATGAGRNESTHGPGLGLAACHKSVKALDGRISLVNRVDGEHVAGLDATVPLPLAADGPTLNAT